MRNISISMKIALVAIVCTLIGGAAVLYFVQASYEENAQRAALEAVDSNHEAFTMIKQGDIDKLSSTIDALMADKHIQETFLAGDREALYAEVEPLFAQLKEDYSMTHWYFVKPEPDLTVLLRAHAADDFGDQLTRKTFTNAVDTKAKTADLEFGSRMTYSLHVASPWYNDAGEIIGYMNVGEETNHFLDKMKEQTGDDYWLLVSKEGVDQEKWAARREKDELEDTWDLQENLLLVTSTSDDNSYGIYDGDVSALDEHGEVIEEITVDGKVFVRGIFPITDVNGKQSGAVVVLHDITELWEQMKASQTKVVIAVGAMLVLIPLLLTLILNSLVGARLKTMLAHVDTIQTRVAGGDFSFKPTEVTSGDEIGRFENRFNEFMAMVVDMMKSVTGGGA